MGPDMSESPWQPILQPPTHTYTHTHMHSVCISAQIKSKTGPEYLFNKVTGLLLLFSYAYLTGILFLLSHSHFFVASFILHLLLPSQCSLLVGFPPLFMCAFSFHSFVCVL